MPWTVLTPIGLVMVVRKGCLLGPSRASRQRKGEQMPMLSEIRVEGIHRRVLGHSLARLESVWSLLDSGIEAPEVH